MPDKSWNEWKHKAIVKQDAAPGECVTFKWHFERGVLRSRMSALELTEFLIPHLPSVIPLLSDYPNIQCQLQAILVRLVMWPKEALDELALWIRPVVRTGPDDLVILDLTNLQPQPSGPIYSIPGV